MTTTATTSRPLTLKDLERWDTFTDAYGWDGDPKKARGIDKRLFTIPPAILGVMDAMDRTFKPTADAVRLANRAVGLFERPTHWWQVNNDRNRAHVVCDWATRYAFPIWLDRLPTWCQTHTAAEFLRNLEPLHWTSQYVRALSAIMPLWPALTEGHIVQQSRGDDTPLCLRVGDAARLLVRELAEDVSWMASANHQRKDSGHCRALIRELATTKGQIGSSTLDDTEIAASLPQVINILLAIRSDDSPRDVAERCRWTTTTARRHSTRRTR